MSAAKRHDLCGAYMLLVCIQSVVRCSSLQNVKDRRLKSFLEGSDAQALHAARKAARSELLLQEEPGYVHVHGWSGSQSVVYINLACLISTVLHVMWESIQCNVSVLAILTIYIVTCAELDFL